MRAGRSASAPAGPRLIRYAARMSVAARLLRSARRDARMSQAELAARAATSQAALSAYEQGRKDPRTATLARLLAAAGASLALGPEPSTTREHLRAVGPGTGRLDDIAASARRIAAGEELWIAVRELVDAVTLCAELGDPSRLAALLAPEPPPTGDARADALLGGLAEHLAARHGAPVPRWSADPGRFLDRWWFPHRRAFDALALRDAPAALRRRGVFVHHDALERV